MVKLGANSKNKEKRFPNFRKSLIAMTVLGLSVNAYSQEAEPETEELEKIEVKGVRGSLLNAQNLKRDADTFVDAITASDIGALPDRSVLEAMQRLPGVSIERFVSNSDPDHFSTEGSGAVVRGMTQTRSEFNGRDSFSANSGRGLSFQDVPPELMAGVDIYKNQTADMIEGGIAGTISLRTRKPFDQQGETFSISGDLTRGDMVGETTPTMSALYSNRWDTDKGEFGFLINLSKSRLVASSHGIQSDRFFFEPLATEMDGHDIPDLVTDTPYIYNGDLQGLLTDVEIGTPGILVPNGSNLTMKEDERDRTGIGAALQWESADNSVKASLQFMRSDARLTWKENALKFNGERKPGTNTIGLPPPGEQFEVDENGVFTSGVITDFSKDWRGDGDRVPANVNWGLPPVPHFGHRMTTDSRFHYQRTLVDDLALNLEWQATDDLKLEFDVQHIKAETDNDDFTIGFGLNALPDYDIRGNGDTPSLRVINPWTYVDEDTRAAFAADGTDFANQDDYFNQTSSYNYYNAMDHFERSEGDSTAVRIDATYFLDHDHFTQVKFGVRKAERDQIGRFSAYNWGQLGPIWNNNGAWLDGALVAEAGLENEYQHLDWSDFFRGGVVDIEGGNTLIHPTDSFVENYANWESAFAPMIDGCDEWRPAAKRVDQSTCEPLDIVDGMFRPSEINRTIEKNTAAYVRIDFEHDDFLNHRISGNVGVRVVKIENITEGNTVYPDLRPTYAAPAGFDPQNFNASDYDMFDPANRFLSDIGNFLPEEMLGFANDGFAANSAQGSFTEVLPSFNLKVELTDDLLGRFAISKAIALPDLGDLRNYTDISVIGGNIGVSYQEPDLKPDDPNFPTDPETGEPLEQFRVVDPDSIVFSGWKASTGNPNLKPMESIQVDASLEWYFADVGSITVSAFHKDLSNFFIQGSYNRDFTNPDTGQTQTVIVSGPENSGEGKMQGVEINYQQFFDMLPAPWDGLGLQANYSYIKARGVPNDNIRELNEDEGNEYLFSEGLPLEGQSDHTANLIAMYEKYGWSARLAYNWRSEYVLTTRDVITKLPIFNSASGFMDGSVFYDINENVKIGIQGVNLLNTQTKTFMKVDNELNLGRSWFVNDRRLSFVVRANF